MRLRYLFAENFLSHEKEEIAFPSQGMYLLAGESGFGKSSFIVDAVAFALFGAIATRAKKQVELLHKDHPGESMVVRALFEFDSGDRLMVARGLDQRAAAWAQVYEPDASDPNQSKLLAEGAQPVGRIIRNRLGGMTWQQFYAAFVARQSEIALLTSLKGAERKNRIHRMLGMRELEKATELTTARLRRHTAELNHLQSSLGNRDPQLEEQKLDEAKQRLEEAGNQLSQAKQALSQDQEKLALTKEALQPLLERQKAQAAVENLGQSVSAVEIEVTSLEEKLSRHNKASQLTEQKEELKETKSKLEQRLTQLREDFISSKEYKKLNEQLAETEEKIIECVQLIDPELKEIDLKGLTKESQELQTTLVHWRQERDERHKQMKQMQEEGACFICLRPLGEGHEHEQAIAPVEERLTELEEKIDKASRRLELLQENSDKIKALAELKQSKQNIVARQEELQSEKEATDLDALEKEGRQLNKEMEEVSTTLAQAEAASQDYDPHIEERFNQAQKELSEEKERLSKAKEEAGQPVSSEEIEAMQQELESLQRQVAQAEGRLPELNKAKALASSELQKIEEEKKALAHDFKALEVLQEKALIAEQVQTYLRGYQRKLAEEIRPSLEEIGSEMLNQVSGGRHTAMSIDDDYEIEVETREGSWIRASMLSGGEEIRANICLRLALTRLVSQRTGVPVRFLVFDEPLPAQDPGHVERILELLDSLRPFYAQQFIISHVGDLRNADEIDYILEFARSGGANRAQLIHA
jgi:DNA repair protein SbcC/Rad50